MDGWKVYAYFFNLVPAATMVPLWLAGEHIASIIMVVAGSVFVGHLCGTAQQANKEGD